MWKSVRQISRYKFDFRQRKKEQKPPFCISTELAIAKKMIFNGELAFETRSNSDFEINIRGEKTGGLNRLFRKLGFTPIDDTTEMHQNGFYGLPIVFYTPDTKWAIGLTGAYLFHTEGKKLGTKSRASYARLSLIYTQLKQLDFLADWSVFTREEKYFLKGEIRAKQFPDLFFGVGNDSQRTNREVYDYKMQSSKILAMKRTHSGHYLGLDIQLIKVYHFKFKENGLLKSKNVTGSKDLQANGLGIFSLTDTRDNILNPYKGKYAEISSTFYRKEFGSDLNFWVLLADLRKYYLIRPKQVLAVQTKLRIAGGKVPFLEMSQIGGDDILRSYPRNRYRDHNMLAGQVEYRFPLFWRFGMTAFAGVGDVFKNTHDLSLGKLKYCIGSGMRLLVNSAERLNLRFDYSYGSQGFFLYASFSESF
jgi:hypothetical protein